MRHLRQFILSFAVTGAVAMSALAPAPATAQSSLSSSSSKGSSSSSASRDTAPSAKPSDRISEGIDVKKIGDLLGNHQVDLGLGAADLGIMVPLLNETFAVVFGDSFTGRYFGEGRWLSPVGLVAERDENGRIVFTRPLGDGDSAEQMIDYNHYDNRTVIPSDVINLNGTLYMQGMWNEGLGNVRETQIWKSTDFGATWTSVGRTSPHYLDRMGNLISWEQGTDGYIYVVSSDFRRDSPVYLSRFREEQMGDRKKWQIFDPATRTWGYDRKDPILSKNVRAGEMSLRMVEGYWVLAMFNEQTASIEVRISDRIDRDWNSIEPARVVVAGNGGWRADQTPNNFTQLYGGYIVPGSTLADMDLVVSQWNTSNNSRYMSTQFNVKGLDTFFGIAPKNAARVGDQNTVDVDESAVTARTMGRLGKEEAMEKAADSKSVPLN